MLYVAFIHGYFQHQTFSCRHILEWKTGTRNRNQISMSDLSCRFLSCMLWLTLMSQECGTGNEQWCWAFLLCKMLSALCSLLILIVLQMMHIQATHQHCLEPHLIHLRVCLSCCILSLDVTYVLRTSKDKRSFVYHHVQLWCCFLER